MHPQNRTASTRVPSRTTFSCVYCLILALGLVVMDEGTRNDTRESGTTAYHRVPTVDVILNPQEPPLEVGSVVVLKHPTMRLSQVGMVLMMA